MAANGLYKGVKLLPEVYPRSLVVRRVGPDEVSGGVKVVRMKHEFVGVETSGEFDHVYCHFTERSVDVGSLAAAWLLRGFG